MKYIDVSEWQGVIDWEKVKDAVDGAIIRAGRAQGVSDPYWERNVSECNRLGIPCGAYWFSEAYTVDMARAEAAAFLAAVRPYRMELPLAYDFEEYAIAKIKKLHGVTVTRKLATDMLYAFCEKLEDGGYWALAYTNPSCIKQYLSDAVFQRFGLWLAYWPTAAYPAVKPRADCQIWQWGGSIIPGITVKAADGSIATVDTNESYVDFRKIIADAGMNRLAAKPPASAPHPAPALDALAWARQHDLCGDVTPDATVTWAELAEALRLLCTGKEETYDPDYNRASGLLTDD